MGKKGESYAINNPWGSDSFAVRNNFLRQTIPVGCEAWEIKWVDLLEGIEVDFLEFFKERVFFSVLKINLIFA